MIPEPEEELTAEQSARWAFTKLAAGMVQGGIPTDVVMRDAREGCDLAIRLMARPDGPRAGGQDLTAGTS